MDARRVSFLQVLAFVARYWRRLPGRFALVAAGVVAAVGAELQIPALAARLVGSLDVEGGAPRLDEAWRAGAWLLAALAGVSLLRQAYFRVWIPFAARVMHRMVNDAFHRVQRFSEDWHASRFAGATVRKISRGMWAYDTFADTLVIDLAPALSILVGFAVAMTLRDTALGLYFAGGVALFLGVSIALSLGYVAPANRLSNDADTLLGGALADAITCNSVVKSFGAEPREDARLDAVAAGWRSRARRAWRRSIDAGAVQSALIVALLGGLVALVLARARTATAPLDDLVYVLTTYFVVNGYLRNVSFQVRNLQRAVNELDDLVEIMETPPQVADRPGARPFRPGAGEVRFEKVGFRYPGSSELVLEGFDLTVKAGETLALVGESGAGKTTLVKLLLRLHDLQEGRILVDGQDIAEVTQESLRRSIALVPQEPILLHRTLRENIAYGRPDASFEAVVEAARRAHAHEFIAALPEGYESLVGERGVKLSGGERQRVALARALLADAPLLVLDEATSSLDSVTEHHIQEAIATLLKGRTSIVIAHRLSTVRLADRILVLDRGRIIEEGRHEILAAKPEGFYRRLLDVQAFGLVDAPAPRA